MNILMNSRIKPRLSVEAIIIRKCVNCGTSGIDTSGKVINDICPSCGTKRPKPENLGVLYDNNFWFQLKRKIGKFFNNAI